MAKIRIHLLNVAPGDCSIIEHGSGRRTMIDICSGNYEQIEEVKKAEKAFNLKAPSGNFRMCESLTNPIEYINNQGWSSIFRFILSHPDMDHMDGLDSLIKTVGVQNFWDTGYRREKPSFEKSFYREEDWDMYESLRDGNVSGATSLTKIAGDLFSLANKKDSDGNSHDNLFISAPSKELLADPDPTDDINEASYIVTYRSSIGNFVFPGDAHDSSWEYAMENHGEYLKNCAFLLAPHHGRDSDRSYEFLDEMNPKWTWIGCAPSKHIDYSQWDRRNLRKAMSNQTGNVVIEIESGGYEIYIENEGFAIASGSPRRGKNKEGYTYYTTVEA